MKKILITSALILTGFISCAQDFTGKNMKTVERMAEQYNFTITKSTLQNMDQSDFDLYNYTWCYHWVLRNSEKIIEVAFHPSSGIVFLQTTSLQQYVKKY